MKRNLIYHVTPIANYKWNLELLTQRWGVFTGRKVIAVATAPGFDKPSYVKRYLPRDAEVIEVQNHSELRESASLIPLLTCVESLEPDEITFYAHTKGVTRGHNKAIILWTELMHKHLLDRIEAAEYQLKHFPICGTFKRQGRFGCFPEKSEWHYSGTFWWFRNKDLFSMDWRNVPLTRYTAEAYLSLFFAPELAGCTFANDSGNPYKMEFLLSAIEEHEKLEQEVAA